MDRLEESIFDAARQLADAAERTAYLNRACHDNGKLRARLELLLSAHGEGGFLEIPAGNLAATAELSDIGEQPGATVGPYKLLEQIGEGGMGLVFMAEQTQPIRRRVALKIIKPGLDTKAVIARFEAERQALAMMDHTNIARVFDAGSTDSGRPYFVMELVRGVPITEYCDRREVDLPGRLELFIQVCQAVQHAHQKGIIHRDLKPTNILVAHDDITPVPKVIDFGVAKATSQQLTDRTLFTHFAQIIGTPLYMSPEQAELNYQDVDTRSDIYSLGVVLYELLTGTTPFGTDRLRSVGPDEMRRIILEEEPPKPSTRATTLAAATTAVAPTQTGRRQVAAVSLKGDLDWIVMKALDKDRRRRYESASALAADVRRYLADEPVDAAAPSFAYRTKKLVRRHRNRMAAITVGAMFVLALSAFGLKSRWNAMQRQESVLQIAGEARTAIEAGNLDVAAQRVAEGQGLLKGGGSDSVTTSAIDALHLEIAARQTDRRRFDDFMKQADYAQERIAVEGTYGRELHALRTLDMYGIRKDPQWRARLDASYLHNNERAQVRREVYNLLVSLAISGLDWKQYAEGLEYLRLAEGWYQPTRAYYAALARCQKELKNESAAAEADDKSRQSKIESAWDHVFLGNLAESSASRLEAYEAAVRLEPSLYVAMLFLAKNLASDRDRTAEAIRLYTGCIALRPDRSDPYRLRAVAYESMDNWAAAAADFDQAVQLAQEPGEEMEARWARLNFYGDRDGNKDSEEDKVRLIAVTKAVSEEVAAALGPNHVHSLIGQSRLCQALALRDPSEESLAYAKQTLAQIIAVLGPDHWLTASTHGDVADMYGAMGRWTEALSHWEAGLQQLERTVGPTGNNTILFLKDYAGTQHLAGQTDKAIATYEELFRRYEQRNEDPPHDSLNNAAAAYKRAGRLPEAIKLFEQALPKVVEQYGVEGTITQVVAAGLLSCYSMGDDSAAQLPLVETIVHAHAELLGPDHKQTLINANNLAQTYRARGRTAEAILLLEAVVPKSWEAWGPNTTPTTNLLDAYAESGQWDAYESIGLKWQEFAKQSSDSDKAALSDVLAPLGTTLLDHKRYADAEPLLRELLAIRKELIPNQWRAYNAMSMLGGALLGQEKFQEAEPLLHGGYEGLRGLEASLPTHAKVRLVEARQRLLDLYEKTGRVDEAEDLREEKQ